MTVKNCNCTRMPTCFKDNDKIEICLDKPQILLSNTLVTKETLSCYPVDLKELIMYKMNSQSIKL